MANLDQMHRAPYRARLDSKQYAEFDTTVAHNKQIEMNSVHVEDSSGR